jgi:hypothetical protein
MGDAPFDSLDAMKPGVATPLYDDRPRLRLHHLLVLTAVMAVLLAINGPMRNYASDKYKPPEFFRILSITLGTAHTLLSAIALTAFGYGIAWHRRGMRFFDQPGHWLLVDVSIGALLYVVPSIAFRFGAAMSMVFFNYAFMAITLIAITIARILFEVYLGMKKCRERRWKSVFYIKAVANLIFGLGSLFILLAIIYALRVDRKSQTVRDQGHWCGVWLELALVGLSLVTSALMICNFFFHVF